MYEIVCQYPDKNWNWTRVIRLFLIFREEVLFKALEKFSDKPFALDFIFTLRRYKPDKIEKHDKELVIDLVTRFPEKLIL